MFANGIRQVRMVVVAVFTCDVEKGFTIAPTDAFERRLEPGEIQEFPGADGQMPVEKTFHGARRQEVPPGQLVDGEASAAFANIRKHREKVSGCRPEPVEEVTIKGNGGVGQRAS